ncbi:hypothetical protein AB0K08_13665 [Citricoccus sp. NPDC055426]|uniref:hypothetical protein n=1 Tax=Citricoccus sp. NPDC055426 TaxID=3155536 RepID=UPI003413B0D6
MADLDPRAILAEMQARADAATEGPWKAVTDEGVTLCLVLTAAEGVDPESEDAFYDSGVSTETGGDAEFIAHARTDLPAMAAALTAVLDLHPSIDGAGVECDVCADDRGPKPYPCPTVHAITDALGGDRG